MAAPVRSTPSTTSRSMKGRDGKTVAVKTFGRGGHKQRGRIVEPRWAFKPYGKCGKWVSDLFPHLASCVDDIAFLHSMTADSPHPRLRHAPDEHRQHPQRQPVSGLVGQLRPRHRERRTCPASSSCSIRAAGRSAGRRTGRAATCRPSTKARSMRATAIADPRPETAEGLERSRPARPARHPARVQQRAQDPARQQPGPGGPHRQL